jgi:hypothetical protein
MSALLRSAAVVLLLAACASAPREAAPLKAGQLFEGDYVNVRAPNSEGWHVVGSSPGGMGFAKPGFAAQVLMFDLRPSETPEQLVEQIREGIEKNTDPKRFDPIESSLTHTNERIYPCVRQHALVKEKESAMLLEMRSLYCRHPVRTRTGFAAIYSYRGPDRYPALEREAQDFINGIQVRPAGPGR